MNTPEEKPALPGFVYPLLFLAGSLPLWPFARRLRSPGWRAAVFVFPFLTGMVPAFSPWNWLLIAPLLAIANAVFALNFLLFHPPRRAARVTLGGGDRLRRGLGLAAAGLPFGLILVGMEQWVTDVWWSGYYPVNASLDSISKEVGSAWILFAVVLAFTAFYVSPWLRPANPTRVIRLLFWTFAAYFVTHQLYLVLVAIPEWQTEVREIFPPWAMALRALVFQLVIYTGVPAVLGAFFRSIGRRAWMDFAAGLASVALAMLALACVTGMPIHDALLLGQQAEKSGRPTQAIPWYSRALTWSQSDKLKSYLQFRVALLYRKTGKLEEARDAFVRVLVRYPGDEDLLADADEFKEKLQAGKDSQGRRVVIPGIEARTEYKSAYCVPNSLGLLLNFWGDRLGAKRIGSEITQLDRGSLLTDEVYFAESRGFGSLVVPLCTVNDIFRLVDAGIPVLAFIPGHVIAIFGYDEALGTLVTYDVNTFDIWDDQRWTHFEDDWCRSFNTLGIVVPKEMLPKVRAILGPDVERKSEAYLSYLLASLTEDDPGLRLQRLRHSLGEGFFPAGWEYHALSGDARSPAGDDSSATQFLQAHENNEDEVYEFAVDRIWRGRAQEAAGFLEKLGERQTLSPQLVMALSASQLRMGKPDQAAATLAEAPSENLDPAAAAFLLHRAVETGEGLDLAERLGLDLLGREELRGDESRLAFQAWRAANLNEGFDARNLDATLEEVHNYLVQWQPYDTTALSDLESALRRKAFRPNEERVGRAWRKRGQLLEARRQRLLWATGG